MKNKITLSKLLAIAFFAMVTITSCTKDESPVPNSATNGSASSCSSRTQRAYHEHFTAVSAITPTATGVFNPGSGSGNATHIGNANMAFNQLVTFYNGVPVGSTAAPVNQFYSNTLASAGITNVPNTVSSITYDNSGNSVWFTSSTGTVLTPVSATRINFSATLDIIGGSGKFTGATGQVELEGHFNPQLPNQAAVLESDGSITY